MDIVLTKSELRLLLRVYRAGRKGKKYIRTGTSLDMQRLIDSGFVQRVLVGNSFLDKEREYKLTEAGLNYMLRNVGELQDRRRKTIRYWITTAIALASLIKSFWPEITAVVEAIRKLLTK